MRVRVRLRLRLRVRVQAHLIVDDGAQREARRGAGVSPREQARVRHGDLGGRQL